MKKRRILAALTVCAMLMSTAAVVPAAPDRMCITASADGEVTQGTYEGFDYSNHGDYIEITGCDSSVTELVIPCEIDGVPVTTIGAYAFASCSGITYISLPSTLETVGEAAFENCFGIYDLYYNGTREMWNEVDIDAGGISFEYTEDGSSWVVVPVDCNGFLREAPIRFAGSEAPAGPVPEVTDDDDPNAEYRLRMDFWFGKAPKLQYVVGEELDLSRGTLGVSCGGLNFGYSWGYDAPISLTGGVFTIDDSAFDSTTPGNYPIYISYTDRYTFYEGDEISLTKTIYITASVYEAEDFPYIEETLPLGDLSDDGIIDANDASMLLVAAANAGSGADSGLTETQIAAADLNADSQFDASDASLILMYAAYAGAGGELDLAGFLAQL